jgi:hypothetical protein
VVEIFGDRGAKRVAIEKGHVMPIGTQPLAQFLAERCLASAR